MDKRALYATMATQLGQYADQDQIMAEQNPTLWQRTREIDDWLVLYRDDDRVSVERYRQWCTALVEIYAGATQQQATA